MYGLNRIPRMSSPVRRLRALWTWVSSETNPPSALGPPSFTSIDSITDYKYSRLQDNPCNKDQDDPVIVIILETVWFCGGGYEVESSALAGPCRGLLPPADDHGGHDDRQRRAPPHPA